MSIMSKTEKLRRSFYPQAKSLLIQDMPPVPHEPKTEHYPSNSLSPICRLDHIYCIHWPALHTALFTIKHYIYIFPLHF